MDATLHQDSSLVPRKIFCWRRRQFVDEKPKWVQSNTSARAKSSPVHRLPTEILSEIFLLCLPQDQPGLAPVLLTTICRRWREVAVGFPKLWCMLQFQVDCNDSDWQQRALFYDSLLQRSRGCPLSLKIVCHDELSELRQVLEPYIKQILSLTLHFVRCGRKPFMVDDFHALKELTVLNRDIDLELAINKSLWVLPVNLLRLDLTRVLVNYAYFVYPQAARWFHLTHLKIKINLMQEFLLLLIECPNLSSLSILGIMEPIQSLPEEPITHAYLQYLHIRGSLFGDYDLGVNLFNTITLPKLCILDFRQTGPWPHEEFKAFVTRSKCPLESLIFGMSMTLTDQEQKECTSLIPSLKRIVGKGYSRDVDPQSIQYL
jgi:hypothetical protein